MAIPVGSSLQLILGSRISGLPNAIGADEPVVLQQVQAMLNRNAFKDDVRVKTTGNIAIASPGATIDAVSIVTGDRVLVASQSTNTENGIYIWNGAAVPMTRSLDAATFDDLESALVLVSEGGQQGTRWRQTAVNGVIGTNAITFISDAASVPSATEGTAGVAQIATQAEVNAGAIDTDMVTPLKLKNSPFSHLVTKLVIGDGSATGYSIPHSYSTTDVDVIVKENSGTGRRIIVETDTPDANTARVIFAGAPGVNSYVAYVTRKV
jgi:hypothetical protein